MLENVMYVRLDGGEALHNAGRTVRRCLTGGEWRWRHWRQVYHIEQRKDGAQGGFLRAYRHGRKGPKAEILTGESE